jgi:amidase
MSALADQTRWMDATDQAALVGSGEMSPSELLEAAIERIERIDPALNAVVIRWFDHARETAASADLPNGPFRGVPFLIKDLFATYAGQRISNGNVAFKEAHVISDADTTLVSRHRAAGLVIAGRTNSSELGSVPTTEPVAWGATHNPWDTTRTPGGSSGGAAAAVASGMVPFAHASDGGGSIRIPASCCGLVGLKPSQGRITLGPIREECGLSVEHCVSCTVRDTAALLDATLGPGIGDTVIAPLGHHVAAAWPKALEDKTFGSKFGALWSANMGLSQRRFGDQLGRPMEDREFEPMNRIQADFAKHLTSVDYGLALSAVAQYRRAVQSWWHDGWDLLLTMSPIQRAGQFVPFTPPFNTSGQPAISLPLEWTAEGLPVGVQLVAAYGREDVLIRLASQLEQANPWAHRTPEI